MSARDEWCTPKWLAEALGKFDIDPCSNERSHIQADIQIELGVLDGLEVPKYYRENWSVFVNPPYSRGQVERWVDAWLGHDYTFLLRWDPSTRWAQKLLDHCKQVWFPDRRINFEPPPGIRASSNPYPHALYFANYPYGERRRNLAALGRFWMPCQQRSRLPEGLSGLGA